MGFFEGSQEVLAGPDHSGHAAAWRTNYHVAKRCGRAIYLYSLLVRLCEIDLFFFAINPIAAELLIL